MRTKKCFNCWWNQIGAVKREEILTDLRNGMIYPKIASKHGISVWQIMRISKTNNVPKRNRGTRSLTRPSELQAKILEYGKGRTLEETGQHFGLTRERVRQIFKHWNIPRENLQKKIKESAIDAAIEEYFTSNRAAASVAKDYGITNTVIFKHIKKRGLKARPSGKRLSVAPSQKVVNILAYAAQNNQAKAAKKFGVFSSDVSHLKKRWPAYFKAS